MSAQLHLPRIPVPESKVLRACLDYLEMHRSVAMAWRANAGGAYDAKGRFIRFGFRGQPDILGMLKGGRFLAVECKSSTGKLTADQRLFLEDIAGEGGLAVVARSVEDVAVVLDGL